MQQHPFITETPLRAFLRGQLSRLERVIAESDRFDRVAQAHRHADRYRRYLDLPDLALDEMSGRIGGNGDAPAIDDICRHIESGFTQAVPHPVHGFAIIDADDLPVADPAHLRRAA